jgi:16S rRNA (cytosine967-C5)-methyltransferase
LEIAAAPGGKTIQLALRKPSVIVSVDSDLRRMRTWRRNMQRMRIPNAHGILADARTLPFKVEFDQVIVDAPCSTLGVIRRHPEVKWWREERDLAALAHLQLEILSTCAKYVRTSGELLYSVCSFEPEETDLVMNSFLEQHPQFALIKTMTLLPHRDETDGFYIAGCKRV